MSTGVGLIGWCTLSVCVNIAVGLLMHGKIAESLPTESTDHLPRGLLLYLTGILREDMSLFSGRAVKGFLLTISRLPTHDRCMNRLAKVCARFLGGHRGFSIGIEDVTPSTTVSSLADFFHRYIFSDLVCCFLCYWHTFVLRPYFSAITSFV